LKAMPGDWRGFYRAGLLEARGGHYGLAEKAFDRAQALSGGNPTVAANLAQIYLFTERPTEAVGLLEQVAAEAPNSADIQRQLGVAYQELGLLSQADSAYHRAMDLGASDPALLNNRAVVLQASGRLAEAIAMLETVRQQGGDSIEALNNLANLYRAAGQSDKAAEIFYLALSQAPLNVSLYRNLALLNRDRGTSAAGLLAARRAAISDPANMDGLVIIAEILEHRADLLTAGRVIRWAVVGAPANADAVALLARILRREGNPEAALAGLRGALSRTGHRLGDHKLLFEQAQVEQALGRFDKAFDALVTANFRQIASMAPGRVDPERAFDRVRALHAMVDGANAGALASPGRDDVGGTPVFLVGFPRSGTTLLDQILDSHPLVRVLEERPLVAGMIARLTAAGHAYPEDLERLDDEMLETLRQGYFADREGFITIPQDAVFIDKMPLNITHAALIRRVFPGARFLLAVRDPCDVCLSCFMQSFELNDWMAVFTDLAATARLYGAVFDLWFLTAEKLRLEHHVVRYEDLIADLRGTAAEAMKFIGLEWDDRMADFHQHARERGHLSTPSHAQVTQPVYGHAVARWKRYGGMMDETARLLKPYRSALGYGD
jgi:Flp pilus assembly protein TadD